MLCRAFFSGRFALGCALWLLASAPALTACSSARTTQERKTERYKRKHKPGSPIPCPTKDC